MLLAINVPRQPSAETERAPIEGAIEIDNPETAARCARHRVATPPSYKSLTIAFNTTKQDAPIACSPLKQSNCQYSTENAQAIVAQLANVSPNKSIGFLPNLSDNGPHTSWPQAKTIENNVKVKLSCAMVADKDCVASGIPGKYTSSVKTPDIAIRIKMNFNIMLPLP